MRTIMSDVPISAPERDTELAAARAAGWRRCDLAWERLQDRAHAALRDGDTAQAARLWRRAWWLAMLRLERSDFPADKRMRCTRIGVDHIADQRTRSFQFYQSSCSIGPEWQSRRARGSPAFMPRMSPDFSMKQHTRLDRKILLP